MSINHINKFLTANFIQHLINNNQTIWIFIYAFLMLIKCWTSLKDAEKDIKNLPRSSTEREKINNFFNKIKKLSFMREFCII